MVKESVVRVYILACTEDASALEHAFSVEGFPVEVIRPQYDAEQRSWSRAAKCLWGHREIWQAIAEAGEGLSMVCEADFVPCVGIGALPLPFHAHDIQDALGYLYAGGAEVFDIHHGKYARGHASCTVAYVAGAAVARRLIHFADIHLLNRGTGHTLWDCDLGWSVKSVGVKCWMPYRQYGEHGGIPNPEHAKHGFNPSHQSDILYGPLHFLPAYAGGSRFKYWGTRLRARCRGIGRLVLNRYLHLHDCKRAWRNRTLVPLLKFSILRHFYFGSRMSKNPPERPKVPADHD